MSCVAPQRNSTLPRRRSPAEPNGPAAATLRPRRSKTFAQAAWQIVIADVSMSLDNVLAVAGAAREHPLVLIFGLGLSDRADGHRGIVHRAASATAIDGSPMWGSPSSSTWRCT